MYLVQRVSSLTLIALTFAACSSVPNEPSATQPGPSQDAIRQIKPPNPMKEHRRSLLDAALAHLIVDGDRVAFQDDPTLADPDGLELAAQARGLAAQGATLESIAVYVDALSLRTDDATLYFELAQLLEQERVVETAIAVLRTGLDHAPLDTPARRHLGGLLQAVGDLDAAADELRAVLDIHPDDGAAHAQLSILAHRSGDLAAARTHARSATASGTSIPAQLQDLLNPRAKSAPKNSFASLGSSNIGPEIRIDNGTTQINETTASSSALRPQEVVSAWHTYDEPNTIRIAAGVTFNAGDTWNQQLIRPPVAFRGDVEGDPMSTVDPRTGNSWVGGITFEGLQSHLFAARRSPGVSTFQTPVMIRTNANVDKALMTSGPRPGLPQTTRLYTAYTITNSFEGNLQFSDNLGASWSGVTVLPEGGLGYLPRVGPNGELYIVYWDGSLSFPSNVRLARSFNGGATFNVVQVAQRLDWWNTNTTNRLPGDFRTPIIPYMAVNPVNGHLYVIYFDTTNTIGGNDNVDLYFTRSTDQGATWTPPTPILAAASPADQFFPWIEVDSTGRLHLLFWDTRNVAQNDGSNSATAWLDIYYASSVDGGTSWSESRLTSTSFNAALAQVFGGGTARFLGDYSSLAVSDDVAHAVYLSTQNGDADLFTRRIETAIPPDARDDYYATFRNDSLTVVFDDLLINDVSLSGGTLSVCGNTAPIQGTFTPTSNGGTYTPSLGFSGQDQMGITVCDSQGGQASTTLFFDVLPGSRAFSDDFEKGINKAWTVNINQGSYAVAIPAAALQQDQGLEVAATGIGARAFLQTSVQAIDNYHVIFQLDPTSTVTANGDIHTVLRGQDIHQDELFEIQVNRPSSLANVRARARLRGSNGVWTETAWVDVDRPASMNLAWNAGPSIPFSNASLTFKVDGTSAGTLTAVNSNKVTQVRLGINDLVNGQSQGLYRFDSFYASSVLLR